MPIRGAMKQYICTTAMEQIAVAYYDRKIDEGYDKPTALKATQTMHSCPPELWEFLS